MSQDSELNEGKRYVSRGGLKLEAALQTFDLELKNAICADLGANIGGFTDCMLQHGASQVYALDTSYGTLAWTLRQDPRVSVHERTNALHFEPGELEGFSGVDLVVIDLGWTRQKLALPAAQKWLKPGGQVVTLVKPHYESSVEAKKGKRKGILDDAAAETVLAQTKTEMLEGGWTILNSIASPIRGGGKRSSGAEGNREYLVHLTR